MPCLCIHNPKLWRTAQANSELSKFMSHGYIASRQPPVQNSSPILVLLVAFLGFFQAMPRSPAITHLSLISLIVCTYIIRQPCLGLGIQLCAHL